MHSSFVEHVERNSKVSHTVTVQLVDQNSRLLIAIWHLNATACNIQKREGKEDGDGGGGAVEGGLFVMYNGPTLTEGEGEVSFLADAESMASSQVPKETGGPWTGGGSWAEAMRLQFPTPQKGKSLQGTAASALSPELEGPQWVPGCLQWIREREEHTYGALSRGHPG